MLNLRIGLITSKVGLLVAAALIICGCSQAPAQHLAVDVSDESAVGVRFETPVVPAAARYLSPAEAVALARKDGAPWSSRPASVTTEIGNFSDLYAPSLATRTPAYLVTFKGHFELGLGRGLVPAKNTEWVVVIDARTGHRIESFSYR